LNFLLDSQTAALKDGPCVGVVTAL
jgi:hypothetical protein